MSRTGSICLVANDLDYLIRNGGIGSYYWLLAHLLAKQGWRVQILFCGPIEDAGAVPMVRQKLAENRIGLSLLQDFPRSPELRQRTANTSSWYLDRSEHVREALERLHATHRFDLIEFAEWGGTGFRSVQAKRTGLAFGDARLVVKLHSPSFWEREGNLSWMSGFDDLRLDFCEKYAFEHADVQLSASQYMLDHVRQHGWAVRPEAKALLNPFPAASYSRQSPLREGVPELVFFGRLETRKGLELFVEAAKRLDPDVPVTFLGKDVRLGGEGSSASAYLRAELAGRRVTILSDFNREQALRYLAEGNRLAVMPSLADNLPFTVIEAAVQGIPFIASRVGGIPEIVPDSELHAKILFVPNWRGLYQCLTDYLAASPEERAEWVARAQALAEPQLTHDRVVAAYAAMLEVPLACAPVGQPLVSVGVPYYNLGRYLPETLASLANQTYPNLDVVVINDGSTEAHSIRVWEEQQKRYPQFRFITQENAGIGAARNRGLAEARGEYFIPMDADNVAHPEMVSRFVTAIARNPGVSAVSCYFLAFTDSSQIERGDFAYAYRPTGGPVAMGCYQNVFGDANAIFRTADFRAIGGYETDRDTSYEDWEGFAKLIRCGYQMDVVPDYLFYYRHLETGFSRVTNPYRNHRRVLRQYEQMEILPEWERRSLWNALFSLQYRAQLAHESVLGRLVMGGLNRVKGRLKEYPTAYKLAHKTAKAGVGVVRRLKARRKG